MKKALYGILGILTIITGEAAVIYIALWRMFIKPIIDTCMLFDQENLTAVAVGKTVLSCIFASTVGSIGAYAVILIGLTIISIGTGKKRRKH